MRIDARLLQIPALSLLLILLLWRHDPGVNIAQGPVCLLACLAMQAFACRVTGVRFDWRSPTITALSLTLLLRTQTPLLWPVAACLAIGSKFVLRHRNKHIFNPANFAIASLLIAAPHLVWVSPGQWGSDILFGVALTGFALTVLAQAGRIATAGAFLLSYAALLLLRCWWLEDPLSVPLHQMQSGALLLFAFFMITDPRTTPDHFWSRTIFVCLVALVSYWLQFSWQIRPAPFLALFILSPLVPLFDRSLPYPRFTWRIHA